MFRTRARQPRPRPGRGRLRGDGREMAAGRGGAGRVGRPFRSTPIRWTGKSEYLNQLSGRAELRLTRTLNAYYWCHLFFSPSSLAALGRARQAGAAEQQGRDQMKRRTIQGPNGGGAEAPAGLQAPADTASSPAGAGRPGETHPPNPVSLRLACLAHKAKQAGGGDGGLHEL